jgi:hypothetical protein
MKVPLAAVFLTVAVFASHARSQAADSIKQIDTECNAIQTSSGKLIQKTAIFEQNDPMLAKMIEALPFYNVLPK